MNLSQSSFDILLSLANGPRHGYAMIQAIEKLRDGRTIQPGLLYTTLGKMLEAGLIEEAPASQGVDKRRRYYKLTQAGLGAMQQEAREQMAQARRAHDIAWGASC